jgi:hypothetical protein
MKKTQFKLIFSIIILASMSIIAVTANAAPVKFKQVVQVVNAKPGKASTGSFSKLRLADTSFALISNDGDSDGDGDDKKKKSAEKPQQDTRVITTTISEIADDEDCQCDDVEAIAIERGGFPKWPLFGLGAVPLAFIKTEEGETPTPTPTTQTPTPMTPTPQEPPVPEPMTLLLFGTGLAGVGLAARKKFGKKADGEKSE